MIGAGRQTYSVARVTKDAELQTVLDRWCAADPDGMRTARVFRETFDQLYDGQRTGRYRWSQLYKTEKTHYGTLLEINLRREFNDVIDDPSDKTLLDYQIAGIDIDCKYSMTLGGWMIPPEARGQLLLVANADDQRGEWSLGIVRASADHLGKGTNRDGKTNLNAFGRQSVEWLWHRTALPPNVLLQISDTDIAAIFEQRSGQKKLNELFRRVQNRRVGRNTVATVAQQQDYMKRVRENGGARTRLQPEGIIILAGEWAAHRAVATELGCAVPADGEFVAVRVAPAVSTDEHTSFLGGDYWRLAGDNDPVVTAPPTPISHKL